MSLLFDVKETVRDTVNEVRFGKNSPFRQHATGYETLQTVDRAHDPRTRDVYNRQQIERSDKPEVQTMFSRTIAAAALTLGVVIIVWLVVSVLEFVLSGKFTINWLGGGIRGQDGSGVNFGPTLPKLFLALVLGGAFWSFIYTVFKKNLQVQNLAADHSDINQYDNDQRVMFPEEIAQLFDVFPDAGYHSSVSVSSMLSHMAISNHGLKPVQMVQRHADPDDDTEFYAAISGDTDLLDIRRVPCIDEEFQMALFEASGISRDVAKDFVYDPSSMNYNPHNRDRDKLKGYDTIADTINGDWELPLYETQRAGGIYLVDTAPVNTMVLAITRAGKGQTIIEPTIDMWLREKNPQNIVVNDPKGELLVKNYVPAAVRGFQPVQFNLINPMKTDIYNPLVMAAQAAREGDTTKCAQYVENIAEVFFPLDGGEDPVWPNAANNAFKRAAYGLIDYYLEEEKVLRLEETAKGTSPEMVDTMVDQLWGKVTLYNCYQLFVILTAKKKKNPQAEFAEEYKNSCITGEDGKPRLDPKSRLGRMTNAQYKAYSEITKKLSEAWDGEQELDLLTLYFNATEMLPRNSMRTLVGNANNALKAMGGADKMMASVYGIAITAMSFFSNPTISTLTSGTPSQNVDLGSLSFPRRFGVRFHPDFIEHWSLTGLQCRWQAYSDPTFRESLGADFYHEDLVSREGWARFYFKGIIPGMTAYFKLEILNPMTGVLVKTFYFRFDKAYQKSLDGRTYVTDPVLETKIVKDGVLTEYRPVRCRDGKIRMRPGQMKFDTQEIYSGKNGVAKRDARLDVITGKLVSYCEKPKIIFLVTPPHLMSYAKLILILVKQLVDLNFDKSYMTKPDQKPLYKTRYMLDELGNLQSEGHGISGFETMLSIGLGQDQQFTLILQTLQQLRDVYGESVDKIVQGNAQPLTSKIATSTGWKPMGDMSVGTEVLTPRGTKTQVTGIYPRGVRKVYRVTRKDGSSCLVCGEHLWKVKVQ